MLSLCTPWSATHVRLFPHRCRSCPSNHGRTAAASLVHLKPKAKLPLPCCPYCLTAPPPPLLARSQGAPRERVAHPHPSRVRCLTFLSRACVALLPSLLSQPPYPIATLRCPSSAAVAPSPSCSTCSIPQCLCRPTSCACELHAPRWYGYSMALHPSRCLLHRRPRPAIAGHLASRVRHTVSLALSSPCCRPTHMPTASHWSVLPSPVIMHVGMHEPLLWPTAATERHGHARAPLCPLCHCRVLLHLAPSSTKHCV